MFVLKISGLQNQLHISFGTALVFNKILKVRNSSHEFPTFEIIILIIYISDGEPE